MTSPAAKRILIVEDDPLTATMVRTNLVHDGYKVTHASDVDGALTQIGQDAFDVIILDYMLGARTGIEVLSAIRKRALGTPVMMLTARSETRVKVEAFDIGADDYLTKPFHVDELLARTRALIRRSQARIEVPTTGRIRFGSAWVDLNARTIDNKSGEKIALGDKEGGLIALFAGEPRRVFTRADILDEVWGMDQNPVARTVDNYILIVRRLIEPDPNEPRHLITIRGQGYQYLP